MKIIFRSLLTALMLLALLDFPFTDMPLAHADENEDKKGGFFDTPVRNDGFFGQPGGTNSDGGFAVPPTPSVNTPPSPSVPAPSSPQQPVVPSPRIEAARDSVDAINRIATTINQVQGILDNQGGNQQRVISGQRIQIPSSGFSGPARPTAQLSSPKQSAPTAPAAAASFDTREDIERSKTSVAGVENSGPVKISLVTVAVPTDDLKKQIADLISYRRRGVEMGSLLIIGREEQKRAELQLLMAGSPQVLQSELPRTKEEYEKAVREKKLDTAAVSGRPSKVNRADIDAIFTKATKGQYYGSGMLSEFKLTPSNVISPAKVLAHYRVVQSPVWIVRAGGKDFVFEGYNNIDRFLTGQGQFNPPDDQIVAQQDSAASPTSSKEDSVTVVRFKSQTPKATQPFPQKTEMETVLQP